MISKELAKKIRYIQIYTNKAVTDFLGGEYTSVFKGRGMEFEEVREYTPGDEIRSIDWNVTARMGEPFIKRYVEERELTVMFLVDLSASGIFGSGGMSKNEVAAELCALLAFSAIRNNDKVGLIIFTDHIEMFIPPKKGVSHVLRLIRELLTFKPSQSKTDITNALNYLGRVQHKKCVVFLVSDFQAEGYEKKLAVVGRRHDLVAVSIVDPRERRMPNVGLVDLVDAETGQRAILDSGSKHSRRQFEALGREQTEKLREMFRSNAIDHAEITCGDDYVYDLIKFFKTREKRRG